MGGRDKYWDFLTAEWSVCTTLWEALGWDTLRSAVLVGTWIWSGVSWFQRQSIDVRLDWHPRASRAVPQVLTLWVYHQAPEPPFFKGMLKEPEVFLELPGVSGLRPCARTHIKKALCHTLPVGGTNDKYLLPPSCRTWQFRTDPSTCCTNTLILYICSVYTIHLFHILSLLPCLLSGP